MRDQQYTFSVIVVNYNGGEYLQESINSLKRQDFLDFEVLLIDNNSQDDSALNLDVDGFECFTFLCQDENHGFAKGNNIAAKEARGEWLVLLNPDAIAKPDWLSKIAAAIKRHPDRQVFACSQISMNRPDILDGAGDAYLAFGMPWRNGFARPISELPQEDSLCFSPCGASGVYKRTLFLSLGGFDERFFCYCEDVDLGMRLQLSNERCVFIPDAMIYHEGSGITGRHSYFTMYHGFRNRTWAYLKNMPLSILLITLPGHVALTLYIYLRNRGKAGTQGMGAGIWAGIKQGWRLRCQKAYRVNPTPKALLNLIRSMSWNPYDFVHHRVHIRTIP